MTNLENQTRCQYLLMPQRMCKYLDLHCWYVEDIKACLYSFEITEYEAAKSKVIWGRVAQIVEEYASCKEEMSLPKVVDEILSLIKGENQ